MRKEVRANDALSAMMTGGMPQVAEPTAEEPKNKSFAGIKDGYQRTTYIIPSVLVDKVRVIAKQTPALGVSDVARDLLQYAISAYEKKHGEVDLDVLNDTMTLDL